MVAAFDPVLEDFVEKHSHGREDRDVIGGLIQVYQVDQKTWDTMDVVTKIQEQLQQQTNDWYEERDEYRDAALQCYNAPRQPGPRQTAARTTWTTTGASALPPTTTATATTITVPPKFRQYLCYVCPFQQTYIQVELRRKRGAYR